MTSTLFSKIIASPNLAGRTNKFPIYIVKRHRMKRWAQQTEARHKKYWTWEVGRKQHQDQSSLWMNRSLLQSPAVAAATCSPPLPVPSSSPAVSKNRRRCFSLEEGARAMHFYVQSLQEGEGAGARVWWAVRRFASMQLVRSGQWMLPWSLKVIGCSSLRGGGGELGTNKNFDLWLQLVCTKLKLKHAI